MMTVEQFKAWMLVTVSLALAYGLLFFELRGCMP